MRVCLKHEALVSGHYTIQVVRPSGIVKEEYRFDNYVVDSGLEAMGGAYGFSGPSGRKAMYVTCAVGTGQTAPKGTDTGLAAHRASVAFPVTGSAVQGEEFFVDGTPAYWRRVQRCSFGPGVASGDITEVGVFSEGGVLFSRSLIKDSTDRPIAITILNDETVNITFEARTYINRTALGYELVTREGEVFAVERKAYTVNVIPELDSQYGGHTPAVVARESNQVLDEYVPASGATANLGLVTAKPYIVGSRYRDYKYSLASTAGNFAAGIGSITVSYLGGRNRWLFSPPIPKTNRFVMWLDLRFSWGRYAS